MPLIQTMARSAGFCVLLSTSLTGCSLWPYPTKPPTVLTKIQVERPQIPSLSCPPQPTPPGPSATQRDVASLYGLAIRSTWPTDWGAVNLAIMARWPRGLERIKEAAWSGKWRGVPFGAHTNATARTQEGS